MIIIQEGRLVENELNLTDYKLRAQIIHKSDW